MTEITPAMTASKTLAASILIRARAAQSGFGQFAAPLSTHRLGVSWHGIGAYTGTYMSAADRVKAVAARHALVGRAPTSPVSTKRQTVKKNGTNGSPHWRIPV